MALTLIRKANHPRLSGVVALALAGFALAGCYPGQYPTDNFREMHYQQSQRLLEAQRSSPPEGSVPRTGAKVPVSFADAAALQNPVRRTPENMAAAKSTFDVNCGVCHGQNGNGQSFVAERFRAARTVAPADLTSSRVRGRSDGELYWIITNGMGNMPPFGDLLTDDEVWSVVLQVRELQGQR